MLSLSHIAQRWNRVWFIMPYRNNELPLCNRAQFLKRGIICQMIMAHMVPVLTDMFIIHRLLTKAKKAAAVGAVPHLMVAV